jgi:hypothetical protein
MGQSMLWRGSMLCMTDRKIRHFPGFQKGDNFTTFSTDVFTIGFEHLLTLKMALLLDLSNELLIEIILCLAQYGVLWVKKLSYTCKRLNACCAPWIFKTYHLSLPVNSPQLSQSRFNTIAARLQNFRNKASYVQDLTLRFGELDDQDVDELFPCRAMPDLIDALSCANKLISIQLTSRQRGELLLPLWNWLTTKNLTEFKVGWLPHPMRRRILEFPPSKVIRTKSRCDF